MQTLCPPDVGILPVGALGVGLFHYLTSQARRCDGSVVYFDRPGSSSSRAIHASGGVRIRDESGVVRLLPKAHVLGGNLVDRARGAPPPGILLVACNPDQLLGVVSHVVDFVCEAHVRHGLNHLETWMPAVVLCPNGIYFQRVRLMFSEKLEEAVLLRRLPSLWPDHHDRILAYFLRGVTMQTGVREGSGGDAVYRPGPRGHTIVAGGGAEVRKQTVAVLAGLGGWYEDGGSARPTRFEFDKGLVNLASNLLGQLCAIDETGRFVAQSVGEILDERQAGERRELARHMVAVGRAVGAYAADENPDEICALAVERARAKGDHVPSSLQYVALELSRGTLRARLTPTEQWLFEPLIRYARSAGLDASVSYFRGLRERVVEKLRLAIAYQVR